MTNAMRLREVIGKLEACIEAPRCKLDDEQGTEIEFDADDTRIAFHLLDLAKPLITLLEENERRDARLLVAGAAVSRR